MNRPCLMVFLGFLLVAFGCSAENPVGSDGPIGGGAYYQAAMAGGPAPTIVQCPMQNQTRPCACDTAAGQVSGSQRCEISSGWQQCECADAPETLLHRSALSAVADPALNRGPGRFDWERTEPTGGSCESGHYEGSFDGFYLSAATWGWGTIPVMGNVAFDLGESADGEVYTVSNGRMNGAALGMFPFEGDIVGDLDCGAQYFDGMMKNCQYLVGILPYKFEGLLRAKYDKTSRTFVSGLWSVTEPDLDGNYPPAPDIQPGNPPPSPWPAGVCGGTGTWSAIWEP